MAMLEYNNFVSPASPAPKTILKQEYLGVVIFVKAATNGLIKKHLTWGTSLFYRLTIFIDLHSSNFNVFLLLAKESNQQKSTDVQQDSTSESGQPSTGTTNIYLTNLTQDLPRNISNINRPPITGRCQPWNWDKSSNPQDDLLPWSAWHQRIDPPPEWSQDRRLGSRGTAYLWWDMVSLPTMQIRKMPIFNSGFVQQDMGDFGWFWMILGLFLSSHESWMYKYMYIIK